MNAKAVPTTETTKLNKKLDNRKSSHACPQQAPNSVSSHIISDIVVQQKMK